MQLAGPGDAGAVPTAGARWAAEIPMLCGRRDERAVMDGLLGGARAGRRGVLVLRGEAGIGKTALLEYAIGLAPDMTVARAVGAQSEMEVAFAGLHQLCAPLLDRLDALPTPQCDALAVTFGLREGSAPDRFFVGLAVLGLLSEAAEERPLLCVIDDAQWLDKASAQTMAFVARRLLADSVVVLFAERDPSDEFAGLPELVLERLRGADARSLLASVLPGRLDQRVAHELLAETRGNPLALLELPRALTTVELAGGFGFPRALTLQGRMVESFRQRLQALPTDTQRLVLVAAAEPTGDSALVWRAVERLGITPAALEPAESAGLIEVDGRVRFRHPLVRLAVYGAASPSQRRRVHAALAEATDAQVDPDRRVWHLAEATAGADEEVAAELERAAGRAQARGGLAAAAAFLARASAMTPEPSRRAQRASAAAQAMLQSGAPQDALALLATVDASALGDLERAHVQLLRAQVAFVSSHGSDAPPLLLEAAQRLEPLDVNLAREAYLDALSAAMFAGRLATSGAGVLEVAQAARAVPQPLHRPRVPDLLLDGFATLFTEGYGPAVPILRQAQSAFGPDLPAVEQLRWLSLVTISLDLLYDDIRWETLAERHVQLARDTGALSELPAAMNQRVYVHLFAGELTAAASLVEQIQTATEATGINLAPYGAVGLAAIRGRKAEAASLIARIRAELTRRGEGIGLSILDWAEAVLHNGLGLYEEACAAVVRVTEHPDDVRSSNWWTVELIEAAVRTGRSELAFETHRRLLEMTEATATDWALGVEARSRALLVGGAAAEGHYLESIDRLVGTRMRLDLARAHLLYGEWLRGERRRFDARGQLRTAFEMFTDMGIEAFAGRAERELLATGERVSKRSVETRAELTDREAQVARLARDGLSNAEIGDRLFISQHTVAYHLRKVFVKLDVTSRNQLRALAD
jgi:DNA-binding CsgD family transcriptional regulator